MTLNPFLKLQYHINGGWRRLVLISVVFLGLMGLGWYLSLRLALVEKSKPPSAGDLSLAQAQASAAMVGWIALAQAIFLFVWAPAAVRKAVLTDFQSGMIESHRLTPLTGIRIVLGYLTAAPLQPFVLYGISLLLGGFLAAEMGRGIGVPGLMAMKGWLGSQAVALSLGFMIASFTALFSLQTQGKIGRGMIPLTVVIATFGGGILLRLAPALGLVIGWLAIQLIFGIIFGGMGAAGVGLPVAAPGAVQATFILSIAAQIAFSLLFLAAAARKVRQPESSLFSLTLGRVLLLLIGGATVAGMALTGKSDLGLAPIEHLNAQLTASVLGLILVAYFPLSAAAHDQVAADRAAAFGEHRKGHSSWHWLSMPVFIAAVIVGSIVASLLWRGFVFEPDTYWTTVSNTLGRGALPIALVAMPMGDFALFSLLLLRGRKVFGTMILWFLVARAGPLSLSALHIYIQQQDPGALSTADAGPDYLAGLSPLGTLMYCTGRFGQPWPGVFVQVLLALALVVWYRRARARALAPLAKSPAPGPSAAP